MSEFIPFPAIDLRKGQVVRLIEGDPERQTSYSSDPAATAERWLAAGAKWLHVVNLDGAFAESQAANRAALADILRAAGKHAAQVQFGGGLRSVDDVTAALDLGVGRAILGTLAVEQPNLLADMVARWGQERIGASLDARGGWVQVRGWVQGTDVLAVDAAKELKQAGLAWLVFTDIARDGLQSGINLTSTVELARTSGLKVIASGGVRGIDDVRAAKQAGLAGIIAGRALYEGTLEIEELLGPASGDLGAVNSNR